MCRSYETELYGRFPYLLTVDSLLISVAAEGSGGESVEFIRSTTNRKRSERSDASDAGRSNSFIPNLQQQPVPGF